jgi:hypothetical protein
VDDQGTIVREIARNDMDLSADARLTAGILLVTIVAVESGGAYMLRLVRGAVAVTPSSWRSPGRVMPMPECWSSLGSLSSRSPTRPA